MDADQKKYEPFRIPVRQPAQREEDPQKPAENSPSLSDGVFYEIDYDASPIAGVGKFVQRSQRLTPPPRNEIRELFSKMRELSRPYQTPYLNFSRFYDPFVQRQNGRIFYEQARFMEAFTDDYPENVPFSTYYPNYQLMGYEQLRTYFTWRTRVRQGNVEFTSRSYAFLYIYELLHTIGSEGPAEGLAKLESFRQEYGLFDPTIEKYMEPWLKDYRIYYGLPLGDQSAPLDPLASFPFICQLAKYDIRKSKFYTPETEKLISECYLYVIGRLRQTLAGVGIDLTDILFYPTRKMMPWTPFKSALFYPWYTQPDRKVILSVREMYLCQDNKWVYTTTLTTDKGCRFAGYLLKQMEASLRTVKKYKYKLTASMDMLDEETLLLLKNAGISLPDCIFSAVREFYREATRTVVTVDSAALARIRREALATQEALTVEEEPVFAPPPVLPEPPQPEPMEDGWDSLKKALSEAEAQALRSLLRGVSIQKTALVMGLMPEVLADGVNEKAMDCIGDSLLDEELTLYEDYEEPVKGMIDL